MEGKGRTGTGVENICNLITRFFAYRAAQSGKIITWGVTISFKRAVSGKLVVKMSGTRFASLINSVFIV